MTASLMGQTIESPGVSIAEHDATWVEYSSTGTYTIDADLFAYPNYDVQNDDMVSALEMMNENIKDAMKNIPYIENQVGGVFMKGSGEIIGLDIYDVSKS